MRLRFQDSKPSSQGKLRHVKIWWQARFKTETSNPQDALQEKGGSAQGG
jgi:hypothetical protein